MNELPTWNSESLSDPLFAIKNDDRAGGIKMGFVAEKWRRLYVLEILCSAFR